MGEGAAHDGDGDTAVKVSLFMFVKGPAPRRKQAYASMVNQTYANTEIIVVDGDVEPDNGPNDALRKAINRCKGDIIGSCQADEVLEHDAAGLAVAHFREHPDWGAITGDAWLLDEHGKGGGYHRGQPFDLSAYLRCEQTPYFCASFFRREALPFLRSDSESVEFDIWCHLGLHAEIRYIPYSLASYAIHPAQSSNNPKHILPHIRGRLKRIRLVCDEMGVDPAPYIAAHKERFIAHALKYEMGETAAAIACL